MDDRTIKTLTELLTSEHSALQAARSAMVIESNGRTASYLTTISAGIVALTLVYQISRFGRAFLIFALAMIPILIFIGISTYVRMVQLDLADVMYTSAINRIHHFYLQAAPEIEKYLSFPGFDDEKSISRARVIYTSFIWTVISYPSGLILAINSLLAGALGGLSVIALFRGQLWASLGTGAIAFLLAAILQYRLASIWFADGRKDFQPRFPEPQKAAENLAMKKGTATG